MSDPYEDAWWDSYVQSELNPDSCGHEECGEYCRYDLNELEREWQDHPERFYWPENGGFPERW